MSTFVGRMKEYIDISIDRYDGINLQSTVYFLSHNHTGKHSMTAVRSIARVAMPIVNGNVLIYRPTLSEKLLL